MVTDIELILRASNGVDLLAKLQVVTSLPDIILMDIQMPEMNGIEATKQVQRHYPSVKVIAFSQFDNEPNVLKMYSLGVKSFIGKDDEMETLFNAIKIVHSGGGYVTEYALGIIQRNLSFNENHSNSLNVIGK
jgi:DNA-binding NarL/FixJ family response regulator